MKILHKGMATAERFYRLTVFKLMQALVETVDLFLSVGKAASGVLYVH